MGVLRIAHLIALCACVAALWLWREDALGRPQGSPAGLDAAVATAAPAAVYARRAESMARMMADIRRLASTIGPRPLGSAAESRARAAIAAQLRACGWEPQSQEPIPLMGSPLATRNLVASRGARGGPVVVLGAHYDSSTLGERCPGANDNASGVAVLLEVARSARAQSLPYELRLVFFGGEEFTQAQPEVHHVGSDGYVARLDEGERQRIAAMLSVDMVAGSAPLAASRLGYGSDRARQWLLGAAEQLAIPMRTDTGNAWSDHEAFEMAGVPSVWLASLPTGDSLAHDGRRSGADRPGPAGRVAEVGAEVPGDGGRGATGQLAAAPGGRDPPVPPDETG